MKKVVCIFLTAAILFALVACSTNSTPPSTSDATDSEAASQSGSTEENSEGKIVLEFPSWQATEPGFAEFWELAITEFEIRNPNAKINMYQVPFADYLDTLTTLYAADTPPQITHIATRFFAQLQDLGWLEPLNDYVGDTLDDWCVLEQDLVVDENIYGVLLLGNGYSLYYNEKIFNDYGVAVPTDFDSFMEAAKALTQDTNNDGETDIYGYGSAQTTDTNFFNEASIFVVGNGSRWSSDGDLSPMISDSTISSLEAFQSLFVNGYTPVGLTVEQKRQYFIEEKLAMIIDGPWIGAMIKGADESIRDNFKMASVPFETTPGSKSNSLHIPVAISDEEKALAWDFISMLTEDEFQQKYMLLVGSPSPKTSVEITDDIIATQPLMVQAAYDAGNAVEVIPSGYEKNYAELTTYIIDAMMKITAEPYADVTETLNELKGTIEDVF